jgi:hypothetical protein
VSQNKHLYCCFVLFTSLDARPWVFCVARSNLFVVGFDR